VKKLEIKSKVKLWSVVIIAVVIILIVGYIIFSYYSGKASKEKVYHVGILSGLDLFSGIADSFKSEMTNLGYIEGKNIVYDTQKTNFEPDKEKKILQKFVDDKVDLIFGFNTEVALEAKNAAKGTNIPVVFANSFTEGNDLINNLKEPGGDITGVRYPSTDVAVNRLETLHKIVPQAKRIWLPYQKGYPSVPAQLKLLYPAAASLNVTLIEFPSNNLTYLQAELENLSKSKDMGFDAVLFIPESLSTTRSAFDIIANFTRERKIPLGGSFIITPDYGTVFAVTVNNSEIGRLSAPLADKILKGIPAGTIPVVTPEAYLKINYNVAQELNITIPEGLLNQASEIIK
jgi:putative tryptophan/tyrosine transport system substrate-binding protein